MWSPVLPRDLIDCLDDVVSSSLLSLDTNLSEACHELEEHVSANLLVYLMKQECSIDVVERL